MKSIRSTSAEETKGLASLLADEVRRSSMKSAFAIALTGHLGAGKTTFTQGFARALGIHERVASPTFVLLKVYRIPKRKNTHFTHLVHIDCYRIKSAKDLTPLGIETILKDKHVIVLIEWPERIKRIMPKRFLSLRFRHGKKMNERVISFSS